MRIIRAITNKLARLHQAPQGWLTVNRVLYDAWQAVAIDKVVLPDKERHDAEEAYGHLNVGHIPDVAEIAASDWGGNVLGDSKCTSPLTHTHHAGGVTGRTGPGTVVPADVGHIFAFGSTAEHLEILCLGLRARGTPDDPPYRHNTGVGYVAQTKGHYSDAINTKNSAVVIQHVETFGGIGHALARKMRRYARRTRGSKAIDRTTYSKHYRKTDYLTHYMRRVSCAAVFTDANAIINMCKGYKTKALAPPDLADAREFPPPSPAQRA